MFTDDLVRRFPILHFFKFEHLPEPLQSRSKKFAELAHECASDQSVHPAEVAAGLRKILEAKDCFVRTMLPADGRPLRAASQTPPAAPAFPTS